MKDKHKIKLLEYWAKDFDNIMKIPKRLKEKIKEQEIADLVSEMPNVEGDFIVKFTNYLRILKSHQRESTFYKVKWLIIGALVPIGVQLIIAFIKWLISKYV